MKKNTWTKFMALLGLFWIIISIVWSWAMIIYDLYSSNNVSNSEELTQEQIEEIINSYSWTVTSTGEVNISTWVTID